jgi:hypothetical protein
MTFEELDELRILQPEKFKQALSEEYPDSLDCISALLENYELHPRGSYGPQENDPIPMSIKELAKSFKLPEEVIYRLQDDLVISQNLTYKDLNILELLRIIWGKAFYLKKQLSKLSKRQREDLMTRPEFATKWEKWVYSIYLKNEIAFGIGGRIIDPRKRIKIDLLAQTIESMFGVPDCYNTRQRILKIRETAYNDKKKAKNRQATIESLCISRGVPLNRVHLEINENDDVMYSGITETEH